MSGDHNWVVTLDVSSTASGAASPLAQIADAGTRLSGQVRVVVARTGEADSPGPRPPGRSVDAGERIDPLEWLRRADLVSIAVLGGLVTGVHLEVALACDLRLMAADAEIAVGETIAGSVPSGSTDLVERLGRGRALELCLTGRRLGAAEAFDIGLVQLVVAPADLAAATQDLTAAVLAAPRVAAIETKALLAAATTRTHRDQRQAEHEAAQRLVDDDGQQHPESEPGE